MESRDKRRWKVLSFKPEKFLAFRHQRGKPNSRVYAVEKPFDDPKIGFSREDLAEPISHRYCFFVLFPLYSCPRLYVD